MRSSAVADTLGGSFGVRLGVDTKFGGLSSENSKSRNRHHLGLFVCGENVEKTIHSNPLTRSVDFFLRVQGESMINAGILNDDLVGVRKTKNVENGEIIVARLGDEVTLKRFKKDADGVRLVAENESFSDIKIDEHANFSVEGKAVGIIREDI